MHFQTYLIFNGNCAQAMRYYERVLGGKLDAMMKMGDGPDGACEHMPPGSEGRIMHACLNVDGALLMASDSMVGQPYEGMKGFGVPLVFPTVQEAKRVYNALADGGTVMMPMDKTFWAEAFGVVTDRFGTPWMVNGAPTSA